MVYLKIKDNTQQAKLMLAYLKTIPFIEVVEKEDIPNSKTLRSIDECKMGGLKRHKTTKSLLKELYK